MRQFFLHAKLILKIAGVRGAGQSCSRENKGFFSQTTYNVYIIYALCTCLLKKAIGQKNPVDVMFNCKIRGVASNRNKKSKS